jgi:hypothetical protein
LAIADKKMTWKCMYRQRYAKDYLVFTSVGKLYCHGWKSPLSNRSICPATHIFFTFPPAGKVFLTMYEDILDIPPMQKKSCLWSEPWWRGKTLRKNSAQLVEMFFAP